nr:MAG TPA: hypothetical protein [Caudoviricetes sp.]
MTGGDINGNLNVYENLSANYFSVGDDLIISGEGFSYEGPDNESLNINSNGLTYAYTESDSQRFNVKEGDV